MIGKTNAIILLILCIFAPLNFTYSDGINEHQGQNEIVEKRTVSSKTYLLEDDQYEAVISGSPVHYKDENGNWKNINTWIVPSSEKGYSYQNKTNTLKVYFPGDISERGIRIESGKGFIEWLPLSVFTSEKSRQNTNSSLPSLLNADNVNSVLYENLFPGISDEYIVLPNMLKQNIIIENPPVYSDSEYLTIQGKLHLNENFYIEESTRESDDGSFFSTGITIKNIAGKGVFTISEPFAVDNNSFTVSSGKFNNECPVYYELVPDDELNNIYTLNVKVPMEWLLSPDRQYPVIVDPTVVTYGATHGGWQSYDGATGANADFVSPTIFVFSALNYSSKEYRGYMKWDISSIPDNAIINDVDSFLKVNSCTGDASVEVWDVSNEPPYGTFSTTYFNDLGAGKLFSSLTIYQCDEGMCTSIANDLSSNGVNDLQNKLGSDWFAVGLKSVSGSAGSFRRFETEWTNLYVKYSLENPAPENIVINEVNTGTPDSVELYNYGPDKALTGWTLEMYDEGYPWSGTYTFPSGFTLNNHSFVQIKENTGTDTATELYTGWNITFAGSRNGEVILKDGSGGCQDYMLFDDPSDNHIPYDDTWTGNFFRDTEYLLRQWDYDTDDEIDWMSDTAPSPLSLNGNQVGTKRRSGVVINEINLGTVDEIEIFNYGPDISLEGWRLKIYTNSFLDGTYTFPMITIPSRSFVRIIEGTGTSTASVRYSGFNFAWTSAATGEAALLDKNRGIDYANWNIPGVTHIPPGTEWEGSAATGGNNYIYRNSHLDTDAGWDWANSTSGSAGFLNTGQYALEADYDELGSDVSSWDNMTGVGRGVMVDVSETVTLLEYKQLLNLDAIQNLYFTVKEFNGVEWSVIFARTGKNVAAGKKAFSSGLINKELTAGNRYAIMTYWDGSSDYYRQSPGRPQYLSFGTYPGYAYEDTLPPSNSASLSVTTIAPDIFLSTIDGSFGALEITTVSLPSSDAGSLYNCVLHASGGVTPHTWSLLSGSLPTGLSLDQNTGVISGTVGSTANGLYSFTVQVRDGLGLTDSRLLTIRIYGPYDVYINNTSFPDGMKDKPYPDQLLSASGGVPPYFWFVDSGALPTGLTLAGNEITGTPTGLGAYNFNLLLQDSGGNSAIKEFTINIQDQELNDFWVRKGLYGGEINACAVSPDYTNDKTVFAAGATRDLFKSTTGGAFWEAISINNIRAEPFISSIAISPSFATDNTVFMSAQQEGILKSIDGGNTWQRTVNGLPLGSDGIYHSLKVAISPDFTNDQTLFAIVNTESYDPEYAQGKIFKSVNGGSSWTDASGDISGFKDIALSSDFSTDNIVIAVSAGKIYRSTDGGTNWELMCTGVFNNISEIRISPAYSSDMTLFLENISGGLIETLWKSTDGGYNWYKPNIDDTLNLASPELTADFNDAGSGRTMFAFDASSSYKLMKSEDGGRSWTHVTSSGSTSFGWKKLLLSPSFTLDETMFLYDAKDNGIWKSLNSGVSLFPVNNGITGVNVQEIVISPDYPNDGTVFLIVKGSSKYTLYKSTTEGSTWEETPLPGNDDFIRDVAVSPTYSETSGTNGTPSKAIFCVVSGGDIYRSTNGGASWEVSPIFTGGTFVELSPVYGYADLTIFSGKSKDGYWRSTNNGANWSQIDLGTSPPDGASRYSDQLLPSPNYQFDDAIFITYGSFGWSTWKTTNDGASWTELTSGGSSFAYHMDTSSNYSDDAGINGTASKTVFSANKRSTDGGATWTTYTKPGSSDGILTIAVSPDYPYDHTIFAGDYGSYLEPQNTGLYKSTTSGTSYIQVGTADGLGGRDVISIALSPDYETDQTLFAGTASSGIWKSTDGGANWIRANFITTLPENITGIAVDPINNDIIYAASAFSGLYKSTDKGIVFSKLEDDGLNSIEQFLSLAISPTGNNIILAGTNGNGIYRSTDSGINWSVTSQSAGVINEIKIKGSELWAATSNYGNLKSTNGGLSWIQQNSGLPTLNINDISGIPGARSTGSFNIISAIVEKDGSLPFYPDSCCNGTDWVGTGGDGVFNSLDGGISWNNVNGCGFGENLTGANVQAVLATTAEWAVIGTDGLEPQGIGIYRTNDADNPCWLRANYGLESTSRNIHEIIESPNGDLLAAILGAENGGVYLSADSGEHWYQINEGFDPDELNVQDLINDNGSSGNVTYYSGKTEDGLWGRVIVPDAQPVIISLSETSGPSSGGTLVTLTGSHFKDGAVVEFDNIDAQTSFVNPTTLQSFAPSHPKGTVDIQVRNPDTRTGTLVEAYTYTGYGTVTLYLSKNPNGTDIDMTWTGSGDYTAFRDLQADFEGLYRKTWSVSGTSDSDIDALNDSNNWFYKVE